MWAAFKVAPQHCHGIQHCQWAVRPQELGLWWVSEADSIGWSGVLTRQQSTAGDAPPTLKDANHANYQVMQSAPSPPRIQAPHPGCGCH